MGDAGDKKKRNANWDELEKSLLKRLVSDRIDVVECKDATTNTHKKKKQAWQEICESFNHLNGRKRDQNQIIKQWRGMKMMLKQVAIQEQTQEQPEERRTEEEWVQERGELTQGEQRQDQERVRRREQGQGIRQEWGPTRNKKEKHEDMLKNKLFLLQKKQLENREKREIALYEREIALREQTMRHNEAIYLKRMAILDQEFENNKK